VPHRRSVDSREWPRDREGAGKRLRHDGGGEQRIDKFRPAPGSTIHLGAEANAVGGASDGERDGLRGRAQRLGFGRHRIDVGGGLDRAVGDGRGVVAVELSEGVRKVRVPQQIAGRLHHGWLGVRLRAKPVREGPFLAPEGRLIPLGRWPDRLIRAAAIAGGDRSPTR
jgi:hypothetical protein